MIQIVCNDENSTIGNNTNIDGRFLEIGDPKKLVWNSSPCFETVQSISAKKIQHKDEGQVEYSDG